LYHIAYKYFQTIEVTMIKKIAILGIVTALMMNGLLLVSANGTYESTDDGPTKITERFYFCRIESSGNDAFIAYNGPTLMFYEYDADKDTNATTTIKSLFGLRTSTFSGEHKVAIAYLLGNKDPEYTSQPGYHDISLKGLALFVDITYWTD